MNTLVYDKEYYIWEFQEWLAVIKNKSEYNWIDTEGNLISKKWYDLAWWFSEWIAFFKEGNKCWTINIKWKKTYIDEDIYSMNKFAGWFAEVSSIRHKISSYEAKWFIDKSYKLVNWMWYDKIWEVENKYTTVKRNKLINFIDDEKRLVSNNRFIYVWKYLNSFARVQLESKKYNRINRKKELLSDSHYDYVNDFHNKQAIVIQDGKYWVIDEKLNTVIDFIEWKIEFYNEDYYKISDKEDSRWCKRNLINRKNWELIFSQWYDSIWKITNGYIPVWVEWKYNLIWVDNKLFTSERFDYIYDYQWKWIPVVIQVNNKRNYLKENGEILLEKRCDDAFYFKDKYAKISLDNKRNRIDLNWTLFSDTWFTNIWEFSEGIATVENWTLNKRITNKTISKRSIFGNKTLPTFVWNTVYDEVYSFSEWFAVCKWQNSYNWIDKEGKIMSEIRYDKCSSFGNWLAEVELNWESNLVDKSFKLVNNLWCTRIRWQKIRWWWYYHNWFCDVQCWPQKKNNLVDINWKLLHNKWFDHIEDFNDWIAKVYEKKMYNLLNSNWVIISKIRFNEIEELKNWYYKVMLNNKYNLLDSRWKLKFRERYENIWGYNESYISIFTKGKRNILNKSSYQKIWELTTDNDELEEKSSKKNINDSSSGLGVDEERRNIREETLERDWFECSKCWSSNQLDVHHILPKHMWWKDELQNLTVLCRKCHSEEHNFNIDERERTWKRKEMSWKLKLVHEAMNEWKVLWIRYRDIDGEITTRNIKPIRLGFKHWRQYVEAYCHLRSDKRSFRISRIEKMSLCE